MSEDNKNAMYDEICQLSNDIAEMECNLEELDYRTVEHAEYSEQIFQKSGNLCNLIFDYDDMFNEKLSIYPFTTN